MLDCDQADLRCFANCARASDEFLKLCPCQELCPNGCPCKYWRGCTPDPPVLVLNTGGSLSGNDYMSNRDKPRITDFYGNFINKIDFKIDDDVYISGGAVSVLFKGEFYIIQGAKPTNIYQVIGCSVQKIGVFSHSDGYGSVCTATSDKIYFVKSGYKGQIFSGSEVLGPYDELSKMNNQDATHGSINIATDGRK